MESLRQDLRHAARRLARSPGFTAVAVLTLALGIGANTAIFSVVNGVLLRPLPFDEPDRLVLLSETFRSEEVERRALSYPDFVDWRERATVFDGLAAFSSVGLTLAGEEPERVFGELVSADYFQVLRIAAAQGRTFLAGEDRTPDTHPVVLVSDELWRRRFGADPGLVGKAIEVNGRRLEVLGILPQGFRGLSDQSELWLPMMLASLANRGDDLSGRGDRWHMAVARLAPRVTVERAQAEMDAIARALEETYPRENADRGALVLPLAPETFGRLRPALWILLGAVGFVLLMGCANLAGVSLARAIERSREIALRAALGAGRGRLIRELLAESLLLAGAGGLAGLALGAWALELLVKLAPVGLPSFVEVKLDSRVLGFTALVSIAAGVLSGVVPALTAGRPDLNAVLKEAGRSPGSTPARRRAASALVVGQVALALVLLVGAGLMLRSLGRLRAVEPGFEPDGLVMLRVDLPQDRPPDAAAAFGRELLLRLAGLPGVEQVALGSDTPLDGSSSARMGTTEEAAGGREFRYYEHRVSPDYFATLGIPLRRGRDFTSADREGSPEVAIVSEALARRFWPGEDPVGKRIKRGRSESDAPWLTVVGVTADVRQRSLVENPALIAEDPDLYQPVLQRPAQSLGVAIRTRGAPESLFATVRREVAALDPAVPVSGLETMSERLGRETALARFSALLLGTFAGLALILASLGIYGLLAYQVSRRTHEVGVRMALGARAADLLRTVLGQALGLALTGLVIGLAAAVALTRLLSALLYAVSPTDPATFAGVVLLLAAIAVLAGYLPARRATRVDPLIALRHE